MSEISAHLATARPFFSVIIPVHNKARYLEKSLSCLDAQTFGDFEIIAVDDCSTDGSLEILQRQERAGKLRLYRRDEPGPGGYAARNLGVRKARADWIVFFDADDIVHCDHLLDFHRMMRAHPGLEFYCASYVKQVGDRVSPRRLNIPSGKYSRLEGLTFYSRDDFFHMNSACTHVSLFQSLGGFPERLYRRGGDVYFWVKLLTRIESFAYSDEATSVWCVDNSSVTMNPANLTLHPMADFLDREMPDLDRQCEKQLRRVVNRKVISWVAEKKVSGKRYYSDLAHISLKGLGCRDALRVLALSMPAACYRTVLKKKRQLASLSSGGDKTHDQAIIEQCRSHIRL